MAFLAINHSGVSQPVYGDEQLTNQIGTIYNRELYTFIHSPGGWCYIHFRNSAGNWVLGHVSDMLPLSFFKDTYDVCTDLIVLPDEIDGWCTYRKFYMRHSRKVVKADNSYWGWVAAGQYVATRSRAMGSRYSYKKLIYYVRGTNGIWYRVTGAGKRYGFVDTGIKEGSMYNTISYYSPNY